MRYSLYIFLILELFLVPFAATGQRSNTQEMDIADVFHAAFPKLIKHDTGNKKKVLFTLVPAAGYTMQTGFAGLVSANAVFKTSADANISSALTSFTYTIRNQIIAPLQANIWTRNNQFNINIGWQYLYYPTYTYGLGGYTTLNDGYTLIYTALRLHQTLMTKLKDDLYAGMGYNYDYFWNVSELNPPGGKASDFLMYDGSTNGVVQTSEKAIGLNFNLLYDNRDNSVNARKGSYVSAIYRPNHIWMGNLTSWQSLVIDARKFIPVGHNTLAFWSYNWLTTCGKPPYLMLPNTGSDPYSNTGRGYIQGRYRGLNMLYAEAEFRYQVTSNGLLGGVLFANAETISEYPSNKFQTLKPAIGFGMRIKLNRNSQTNLAIDYGFGTGGSQGLFVNLGEVF